jgi:hypothetical protein
MQDFPNPFNPVTTIGFRVPGDRFCGSASSTLDPDPGTRNVRIAVYDLLGREVALLVNERKAPGPYEVKWDGSAFPTGVYIYRMIAGDIVESREMLLEK